MSGKSTSATISAKDLDSMLPPAPEPVGSYVPAVRTGNLIFTSGTLPIKDGVVAYQGAVGGIHFSITEGQEAAKLCVLNALSVIKAEIGNLEKLVRVVKLTGYVNSAPSFYNQPAVINGASDFLMEAFGEAGRHARAAVGVSSLPLDAAVELDMVVEVKKK